MNPKPASMFAFFPALLQDRREVLTVPIVDVGVGRSADMSSSASSQPSEQRPGIDHQRQQHNADHDCEQQISYHWASCGRAFRRARRTFRGSRAGIWRNAHLVDVRTSASLAPPTISRMACKSLPRCDGNRPRVTSR